MKSSENSFPEKQACYFLTLNTVDRVDIFIRPVYKQIIVHSLNHFIDHKGLNVFAWCLMSGHLQLLVQAKENGNMEDIEKEFKSFTNKKILEAIATEPEPRKTWILERFEIFSNLPGLTKMFDVWENNNNSVVIDLHERETLPDYIEYIHDDPVHDRIVDSTPDYLYSSARDYAGMKGLVHITKLPDINQQLVTAETTSNFFGKFLRN